MVMDFLTLKIAFSLCSPVNRSGYVYILAFTNDVAVNIRAWVFA